MMLKKTKGLTWPFLGLALATTLLYGAGLAALQVRQHHMSTALPCCAARNLMHSVAHVPSCAWSLVWPFLPAASLC
jgi:hypothetical protein